jgi:hypothetical protein
MLSNLKVDTNAGPGGKVGLSVNVNNPTNKFIDYTGAKLTCSELGGIVSDIADNGWTFGVGPKSAQTIFFTVTLSNSAAQGDSVHCTARAGSLGADNCPNANTENIVFQVQ